MGKGAIIFGILALLLILFIPQEGYAVQEHAGAEGLVAHELSHLFFILVSMYMFFKLSENSKSSGPRRDLRRAFLFFLLWNLITFSTHIFREWVNPGFFKGKYLYAGDVYHYLWYGGSLTEHIFLLLAVGFFLKTLLDLKELSIKQVDSHKQL
ncbi:MAG: hypothetical protein D6710_04235 [Nitrospirae bacterium]|nr:MAG: hypothetical protein D6710_04235 [Nitrospirota bacterium]